MYFLTLVTDYDGTLAHHGLVEPEVCNALKRLRETGRRVVLVTGRDLGDLRRVFPDLAVFDRVVTENGAVLYNPAGGEERGLGSPPDARLVGRLQQLNVSPLSVGRTIIATWEPNQTVVLEAIRDLGLELQIVFNKGAVMVLPPNINKASGVLAALAELGISAHNAVGVGDAENDHAFLRACGCSAAVANALPVIKQGADVVLHADHGAGAIELIDRIIQD
jgi:hydroxymethylpyrimidine pyrophosphatase-like HAD family hydrolase